MNHTSSWNLEVIPVVMENHEITTTLNHHHHHHHHHHQVFPTHHPLLQTPNYNPSCNNQIMNIINKNLHQQLLADHDHIHQDQAELILTKDQEDQEQDQEEEEEEEEELGAMKEMMYRIAAMQPVVDIDPATIRKPKRRNVRISEDPQSVAARLRRERISEKMRILQRLVPGGRKMDTASMLDEAIRYVKFLKKQIRLLQSSNYDQPNLITPPIRISDGLVTNLSVASFPESVSTCNNVIKPYPLSLPSTTTTISATATSSIGLAGGFRFEFEENESDPAAPTMCFNHHEVISE